MATTSRRITPVASPILVQAHIIFRIGIDWFYVDRCASSSYSSANTQLTNQALTQAARDDQAWLKLHLAFIKCAAARIAAHSSATKQAHIVFSFMKNEWCLCCCTPLNMCSTPPVAFNTIAYLNKTKPHCRLHLESVWHRSGAAAAPAAVALLI